MTSIHHPPAARRIHTQTGRIVDRYLQSAVDTSRGDVHTFACTSLNGIRANRNPAWQKNVSVSITPRIRGRAEETERESSVVNCFFSSLVV